MVCEVVLWPRARMHQPPPRAPVRRLGWSPLGGEWTACAVVWWLYAHTHQPQSHMLGGVVVERRALTHQPPHVFLLSQPVRRVGSFPRGGEWTACEVVWWLYAHTHQPPSHMLGGVVVERRALTHQPPHVFLILSQPVRRVGSFPPWRRVWTMRAVVCWLFAHTHQPSSKVSGGAVVEHVALTHQPPPSPRRLWSTG